MNAMNFLLGILLAKDLEPQDKVTVGLLCGLTKLPAAPLLIKPVADKVKEQGEEINEIKQIGKLNPTSSVEGNFLKINIPLTNLDEEAKKKLYNTIRKIGINIRISEQVSTGQVA